MLDTDGISEVKKRKIKKLFSLYDADKNGVLEREDYVSTAQRFADKRQLDKSDGVSEELQNCFLSIWESLKKEADEDGDGKVTLQEMTHYTQRLIHDPAMFHQQVLGTSELLFSVLDTNGDGLISDSEFSDFADCMGFQADKTLFKLLCRGEAKMDKRTLRVRLSEFYYSDDPASPGNLFFGELV